MRTLLVVFAALLGVSHVHALNTHHARIHHKRQNNVLAASSSSSSSSSSSTTSTQSAPSLPVSSLASTSANALGTSTSAPVAVGTGIPIQSLTSGMPSAATLPATTTFSAGATPPISGAPLLPSFVFNTADWPSQDKVPDTNSPQVQAWMKELDGFNIPDINPTADGTCLGDPVAASNAASRGWWTCGSYTRSTDIVACPDKLTWGVSFDDGPAPYTPNLLNYLSTQNLLATFFVVGSRCLERPDILREQYMSKHEISVHTWSHPHLTALTNAQIVAELGWTRLVIKSAIGVTPTTMRPPYGDIDDRVRAISLAMGMEPIIWTSTPQSGPFDTNDWQVAAGAITGNQSMMSFQNILGNASILNTGFIVLEHDLYPVTVDLAINYFLPEALHNQPPITLQPIGKCTKKPATNMYLETTTNTTFPPRHSTGAGGGLNVNGTSTTSSPTTSAGFAYFVPTLSSLLSVGVAVVSILL